MTHASVECKYDSDNPETVALLHKLLQTFQADHPDLKPVYFAVSGLPVTIATATAQLFYARNLKIGGEHLDVLYGDNTPLVSVGLSDRLISILSQPGVVSPSEPGDRRPPLRTVHDLATCGAHQLMDSWAQLRRAEGHDDLAAIISWCAAYAETKTARPAKPAPSDHLVTP